MKNDHKGLSLIILGIVGVIAVVGLVMMFSGQNQAVGQVYTSATGGYDLCNIQTNVGTAQWFPVLAAAGENERLAKDYILAGFKCAVVRNGNILDYINNVGELETKFFNMGGSYVDEFGYQTICCSNPSNGQVNPRSEGQTTLDTRVYSSIPASLGDQRLGP